MPRMPFLISMFGLFSFQMAAAQPEEVAGLMQRNACTACHQLAARTVGPSWQEIAERYRDGSKTAEQLGQSIKKGSSGVWGAVPMPPNAQLSDAELKSLADWILSGQ